MKSAAGTDTAKQVHELKVSILKLTGRTPASSDPRYLAERLARLQARKQAGEDVKKRSDPAAPIAISMPLSAREALSKVLEREKLGLSEAARAALAEWANTLGYGKEAAIIRG